MAYKVLLNCTFESDCEFCIFRGECNGDCPLKIGFYFGNSRSKQLDIVGIWRGK